MNSETGAREHGGGILTDELIPRGRVEGDSEWREIGYAALSWSYPVVMFESVQLLFFRFVLLNETVDHFVDLLGSSTARTTDHCEKFAHPITVSL